jgi:hypothetical protein
VEEDLVRPALNHSPDQEAVPLIKPPHERERNQKLERAPQYQYYYNFKQVPTAAVTVKSPHLAKQSPVNKGSSLLLSSYTYFSTLIYTTYTAIG